MHNDALIRRAALLTVTFLLLLLSPPERARAQFAGSSQPERPAAGPSEHPTLDGLRRALGQGYSEEELVGWIETTAAWFELSLEETLALRSQGFSEGLLASMTQLREEPLGALLADMDLFRPDAGADRAGLSENHIRKMIRLAVPEEEILAAIEEEGSAANLEIGEALDLRAQGVTPALLAAIARGRLVIPVPGEEGVPLLDDILAGSEEVPLLDDLFGIEDEAALEPITDLIVLADVPKAKVRIAPSTTRPADLLRLSDSEGSTPARIDLAPGSHYVIVDKPVDEFDAGIIPALRTVHDGEGPSRTLIESGLLYYDVEDCCLPRSLSGDFEITRISENQQGIILGDEFGGLPPYFWDGNRFLILVVEKARIERVYKVYLVRKAVGEGRILVASFIPPSRDPLSLQRHLAEGPKAQAAYNEWSAPNPAALDGLAQAYGIPRAEIPRLEDALMTYGKATWAGEPGDGTLRLLTLSLDTLGRTRLEEAYFTPEGPFGMLATPKPAPPPTSKKKRKGPEPPPPPPPLPSPERDYDEAVGLPVFFVENGTENAALLRLGDGTVLYVPPGATEEVTVGPGTFTVEARFADKPSEPWIGKIHFTYHARYRLQL